MDESSLLDLLECSVCLERLDTSAKVLPCQHTFCRRCLENIVSSRHELRCPECRVLVDCAVDDLPANILLVRLLDGIKQRPRNGGGRPALAGCAAGVSASPPGTAVRDLPVATRSSPVKVWALLVLLLEHHLRLRLPSLPEASGLGQTE
uniref:RING-type domain-containing protein n=1 Tax=Sinocyclocheilus grahami TaxID=75366 RepID=A0A672KHS5_SINGR